MLKRLIQWTFLGLLCGYALSNTPRELKFQHYGLSEGLSQTSVFTSLQDQQGFLWFGTQDGLNRFDGYSFTQYRKQVSEPHSLSDNYIWALAEDDKGNIWIGTNGGGLDRLDPSSGQFSHFRHQAENPASLSSDLIYSILPDYGDVIWVGTNDGGLDRLHVPSGTIRRFGYDGGSSRGLPDPHIWSLYRDQVGRLWIGTSAGLSLLKDEKEGRFKSWNRQDGLAGNIVHGIFQEPGNPNILWLATNDGLSRFDVRANQFRTIRAPSNAGENVNWLRTILLADDGQFWIGGRGGLWIFDPTTETFSLHVHHPNRGDSLSNNSIHTLLRDRDNNIWVGTAGGAINHFLQSSRAFQHWHHDPNNPESLSNNLVLSLTEDAQGDLWVGTWGGGLNRMKWEGGTFKHYRYRANDPNGLSSDLVRVVYSDQQGALWVGCDDGVIHRLREDGEGFERLTIAGLNGNPIGSNPVFAFHEDRKGRFWVATGGAGLNLLDRESKEITTWLHDPDNPNSLSRNAIYCLFEDVDGTLWLGTDGGGLNRFDPESETVTRFQHEPERSDSIASRRVRDVLRDRRGNLWVGTDNGLNRQLEGNHFELYTLERGLPNNVIYGLLEDDQGFLWISTNMGLSRFDVTKETFQNFDRRDGLQHDEFNTGARYKAADGTLYFGGVGGFNRFDPTDISVNQEPAPIVLTGLNILDEPVSQRYGKQPNTLENLVLGHKERNVSFEFASLDYTNPRRNRYAYKLAGFDNEWVLAGSRRFAAYTNLAPGNYIFRVKGTNADGVWNETGKAVNLEIKPPFWYTLWFRLLMVAAFLALLTLFYRLRMRRFKRQQARLEALVADRTEALGRKNGELEASHLELSRAVAMLSRESEEHRFTAEALREARDIAEQAHRVKSDFLATMSHEIRTPMNGVIGMTALLDETELTREQQEFVHIIKISGETLLNLINDILDFSKIEAGKVELEEAPFELVRLVEETLDVVGSQKGAENLELNYLIAEAIPPFIVGDLARLKQVLLNLVGNAVKFTAEGSVNVMVERRQSDVGKTLFFSVRDTGPGISKESQEKLFQPFTQVDGSHTRRFGGTGLGLAISKRLVELMGGTIGVSSKPGQGATFHVEIPLVGAEAEERPYLVEPAPLLQGKRLLLLAKSHAVSSFVTGHCWRWGLACRNVRKWKELETALSDDEPIDALLVDPSFEQTDLETTAGYILEQRADVPMILLAQVKKARPVMPSGHFQDHLPKPIRVGQLYTVLTRLFEEQTDQVTVIGNLAPGKIDPTMASQFPLKILLAEDNKVNQIMIMRLLTKMGYHPELVENGREVLAILEEKTYDLIFMDVQMPELDGLETTRAIIDRMGKNRPWIMALTANAMEGDRKRCMEAGMDDYISKPMVLDDLREKLIKFASQPVR